MQTNTLPPLTIESLGAGRNDSRVHVTAAYAAAIGEVAAHRLVDLSFRELCCDMLSPEEYAQLKADRAAVDAYLNPLNPVVVAPPEVAADPASVEAPAPDQAPG